MRLLLASVAVLLVATSVTYATYPAAVGNPLSTAMLVDERFEGEVEERIAAGSYVYLRVRDELGQSHWVAALSMSAATSPRVSVNAYARAARFESNRTGRTFAPLLFASVSTPTPTQESK